MLLLPVLVGDELNISWLIFVPIITMALLVATLLNRYAIFAFIRSATDCFSSAIGG